MAFLFDGLVFDDEIFNAETPTSNVAVSITEAGDSVTASGKVVVEGVFNLTENSDNLSSLSVVKVFGNLSLTIEDDVLNSNGSVTNLITGTLFGIEDDDVLSSSGRVKTIVEIRTSLRRKPLVGDPINGYKAIKMVKGGRVGYRS